MKAVRILFVLAFILCGFVPVWAQTDDCASAPLVPIVTTNPCGANWIDVNLAPATVSAETPIPTCGAWPGREDIWFRVQVPAGITSMGFGAGMASSGTAKTGLAVYRGAGCGSLTQLMCKETCTGLFCIGVTGFAAQTVSGLVPGEILYIRCWERSNANITFKVLVTTQTTPPPGDACSSPAPLGTAGCNLYAGDDAFTPPSGTCTGWNTVDNAVFYSFTVTAATVQPVSITLGTVNCAGGCQTLQMGIWGPTTGCAGVGGEGASFHGCAEGTGTVTVTAFPNPLPAGNYILAVDGCSAELPAVGAFCTFGISGTVVPLLASDFVAWARRESGVTTLDWAVGNIGDISRFNIEASKDGNDFQQIGMVMSSVDLSYSTLVTDPSRFFRISAHHLDGTTTFSSVVEVMDDLKHVRPAYPNPVGEGAAINVDVFMDEVADVQVQVCDLSGKVIIRRVYGSVSGLNTFDLNTSSLSPGMYVLSVHGGYFVENQIITIQ